MPGAESSRRDAVKIETTGNFINCPFTVWSRKLAATQGIKAQEMECTDTPVRRVGP
jgi:hypothetical protein